MLIVWSMRYYLFARMTKGNHLKYKWNLGVSFGLTWVLFL